MAAAKIVAGEAGVPPVFWMGKLRDLLAGFGRGRRGTSVASSASPPSPPPLTRPEPPARPRLPAPTGKPTFEIAGRRIIVTVPTGNLHEVYSLLNSDFLREVDDWATANEVARVIFRIRPNGRITVEGLKGERTKVGSDLEDESIDSYRAAVDRAFPIDLERWNFDTDVAASEGVRIRDFSKAPEVLLRTGDTTSARSVFIDSVLVPLIREYVHPDSSVIGETLRLTTEAEGTQFYMMVSEYVIGVLVRPPSSEPEIRLYWVMEESGEVRWEELSPQMDRQTVLRRLGVDVHSLQELNAKIAAERAAQETRARAAELRREEAAARLERVRGLQRIEVEADLQRSQDRRKPVQLAGWKAPFPLSERLSPYPWSDFERLLGVMVLERRRDAADRATPWTNYFPLGSQAYTHGDVKVAYDRGKGCFTVTGTAENEKGRSDQVQVVHRRARELASRQEVMVRPVRAFLSGGEKDELILEIRHREMDRALGFLYELLTGGRRLRDQPPMEDNKEIQPYQNEWGDPLVIGEHVVASPTFAPGILGQDVANLLWNRGTPFAPLRVTPWATLRDATTRALREEGYGAVLEVTISAAIFDDVSDCLSRLPGFVKSEPRGSGQGGRGFLLFFGSTGRRFESKDSFNMMAQLLYRIRPDPEGDYGVNRARDEADRANRQGEARIREAEEEAARLEKVVREWRWPQTVPYVSAPGPRFP